MRIMLRLFLILSSIALAQATCPPGTITYINGQIERCFVYNSTMTTWSDAQASCQSKNGNLASIHNQDENYFISKYVIPTTDTWIGLYFNTTVQSYQWIDGTPYNFGPWEYPVKNMSDSCATIYSNGMWETMTCKWQYSSLCEVPSISETYSTVSPYCPPHTHEKFGKCYLLQTDELRWVDARRLCLANNGELVSIHSDEENKYVSHLAQNRGILTFWNGLNHVSNDTANFAWSDGSNLSYGTPYSAPWKKGLPASCADGPQDCVSVETTQGHWYDCWSCYKQLASICEVRQSNMPKNNATIDDSNIVNWKKFNEIKLVQSRADRHRKTLI